MTAVYTAELYAMYRALLWINCVAQRESLICTNSLSAVHTLHICKCDHPVAQKIRNQMLALYQSALSSAWYQVLWGRLAMRLPT
jgi:hypothetical protein